MSYAGNCTTTRSIAARKLGCNIKNVVLLRVEGDVWIFGVEAC